MAVEFALATSDYMYQAKSPIGAAPAVCAIGIDFYAYSGNISCLVNIEDSAAGAGNFIQIRVTGSGAITGRTRNGAVLRTVTSPTTYSLNTWYRVLLVFDSATNDLTIYVNGAGKATITNATLPTALDFISVGARHNTGGASTGEYFDGRLGRLMIYRAGKATFDDTEADACHSSGFGYPIRNRNTHRAWRYMPMLQPLNTLRGATDWITEEEWSLSGTGTFSAFDDMDAVDWKVPAVIPSHPVAPRIEQIFSASDSNTKITDAAAGYLGLIRPTQRVRRFGSAPEHGATPEAEPPYSDGVYDGTVEYQQYLNACTNQGIDPEVGSATHHLTMFVAQNTARGGHMDFGEVYNQPGDGAFPPQAQYFLQTMKALTDLFTNDGTGKVTWPKWFIVEELSSGRPGSVVGWFRWTGAPDEPDALGGIRQTWFDAWEGKLVLGDGTGQLVNQEAFWQGTWFGGYETNDEGFVPGTQFGNTMMWHVNLNFARRETGTGSGTPANTLISAVAFPNDAGAPVAQYYGEKHTFAPEHAGEEVHFIASDNRYVIDTVVDEDTVTLTTDLAAVDKGAGLDFCILAPRWREYRDERAINQQVGYQQIIIQESFWRSMAIAFLETEWQAYLQEFVGDDPTVHSIFFSGPDTEFPTATYGSILKHLSYYADPVSSTIVYNDFSDAPTALAMRAVNSTTMNLSWTAPAETNGGTITGYQVEQSLNGTDWSVIEADTGSTDTTHQVTGLTQFTAYHWRVSAITEFGVGTPSDAASTEMWAPTWGIEKPDLGVDKTAAAQAGGAWPNVPLTDFDDEPVINISMEGVQTVFPGNPGPTFTAVTLTAGRMLDCTEAVGDAAALLVNTPHSIGHFCANGVDVATWQHFLFHGGGAYNNVTITHCTPSDLPTTQEESTIRGPYTDCNYKIVDSVLTNVHWRTGDGSKLLKPNTRIYFPTSAGNFWCDHSTIVGGGMDMGGTDSVGSGDLYFGGEAWITNCVINHDDGSGPGGVSGNAGHAIKCLEFDDLYLYNNTITTPQASGHAAKITTGTVLHYDETTTVDTGSGPIPFDPDVHVEWVDPVTVPDAPTGLTATAAGETAIDLSWTAPADDGGSAITGYKIERESPIRGGFITIVEDTESTDTTYQDTGLDPDTQYNYRVSAINAVGESDPSNENAATTDGGVGATVPDPPTSLVATVISDTQIDLAWSAPGDDGGSAILEYNVEIDDGTGFALLEGTGSTATTYSATGLTQGVFYEFRVRAVNAEGESNPSNTDGGTTWDTPSAPTGLAATAAGETVIDLAWTLSASDGGTPITGHKIERESPIGGGFTPLVEDTGTTATTYQDTGLDPDTQYNYRVRALNIVGESSPSNEDDATTEEAGSPQPAHGPPAPRSLRSLRSWRNGRRSIIR